MGIGYLHMLGSVNTAFSQWGIALFVGRREGNIMERRGMRMVIELEVSLLPGDTEDECRHLELNACFDEIGKTKELLAAISWVGLGSISS